MAEKGDRSLQALADKGHADERGDRSFTTDGTNDNARDDGREVNLNILAASYSGRVIYPV
jgi:hypothetical protein